MPRALSAVAFAIFLIGPIRGQNGPAKLEPKLEFEVASIKPAPPPDGRGMRVGSRGGPGSKDPGLYTCENCSLSDLVSNAYSLQRYQLTGGPSWMGNERFMISAKIPEGATKEQFRLMQQSLLADRFGLKFHWEKKEMQLYEMVVAKGGIKMKEAAAEEPAAADAAPRPAGAPGPPKLDKDGFPILPPGRGGMMIMTQGRARSRNSEVTMESLAGMLAGQLNKPVIDATGLKGKYDYTLSWVPERFGMAPSNITGGGPPPSGEGVGAGGAPDGDAGPTLLVAVQQQLGLKLEPKKGMVDILVVDHIERVPTEN
jgi:uncharacterized protein (TIGR03435 family)